MSEKVERALEIVWSFAKAEFHSFMEMLYIILILQQAIIYFGNFNETRIAIGSVVKGVQHERIG